jgi:hypothetical protein
MATQTRRTTPRSARFFKATVKASMVTACCGLGLWSAVAAHASTPLNGMPFNGMPSNGINLNGASSNGINLNGASSNGLYVNGTPYNGINFNGQSYNGIPIQGLPMNGLPMHGTSLHGRAANEGSLPPVQSESLPWSTLSQRPLGQSTP